MSKPTPITEIIFVDQDDIQTSQSCLDPAQTYELIGPPQYHYNAALAQLLALFGPTPAPLLEFTAGQTLPLLQLDQLTQRWAAPFIFMVAQSNLPLPPALL